MYNTEEEINYIVSCVGAGLSLVSTSFIIILYSTKPNLQSYSCKFIRYLCITDFFLSLCNFYSAFMLPSFLATWLCYTQAVLITYFLLSSILWTAALSHALHTVVIDTQPDFPLMERRYLVLTYGLPGIALILPFVNNDYGSAEGWCWISNAGVGSTIMRFICYYIPLCLVIGYNFWQYKKVVREINENSFEEGAVSPRLKFYPMILIITQICLILHRIIYFFGGMTVMPLAVAGVLSATLVGAGNALLFGFTEPVKQHVYNCFGKDASIDTSQDSFEQSSVVNQSLNR